VTATPSAPAAPGALSESEVEALLLASLRAATLELFESYGVSLQPVEPDRDFPTEAFLGAVGMSAQGLSGSLILGAGRGALKQSKPGASTDRDWTRELSNQLFGRVKMKLLRAGVVVWSTTPAVISGRHVSPAVGTPRFSPLCFQASDGQFVLTWAEVEVTAAIRLAPPEDTEALPNEGDVILF
jgi:hypothetical protein